MRELGAHKKRKFCLSFRGGRGAVLIEIKVDNKTGCHRGFSRNYLPVMVWGADKLVNQEIVVELVGFENGWLTGSAVEYRNAHTEFPRRTSVNA
jgi:hypothetical protein